MDMVPSCSDLPQDIVQIICEKLVKVIDYVRFGAVCRLWRTVVWLIHKKIPPQPLMLPNSSSFASGKTHKHTFFTVCVKEFCKDKTIYISSSSYGWLLTMDPEIGIYQLFNPFLSENNAIELPFPKERKLEIVKAVLSNNPALTSKYVVMAIYYFSSYISVFRSGDKHCTHIIHVEHIFDDIIYYKDRLYAVTFFGELMRCDIRSSTAPRCRKGMRLSKKSSSNQPKLTRVASLPVKFRNTIRRTLVVSSEDLLCVVRELGCFCSTTVGFRIFKFQTSGVVTQTQWIELKTLNDHTLFLGDTSVSFLPPDFSPYKPNHVYFKEPFSKKKKI